MERIKRQKEARLALNRITILDGVIMFILIILCLSCILPFIHILAKSLSSSRAVLSKEVTLWPIEFNLDSVYLIFNSPRFLSQLRFTVIITVATTVISIIVTSLAAYPLSKRYLPFRFPITMIMMFTIYFAAGLIPTYVYYADIGLLNTPWVLILPVAFSGFNMLIMRTFFMNAVPKELEESARIDGASHFRIFAQIWVPLSLPVFATISLWVAVARWNTYSDSLWFTTDRNLHTLQLVLYNMVLSARPSESVEALEGVIVNSPEALQSAAIMFTTIPILLVYPFLQRFFVKGVTLGSVKG